MTIHPRRPRSWRRRVVLTVTTVAAAGIVAVVGPLLWVRVASAGRVDIATDSPGSPVALVLGAGLTPEGTPTPFLADRLDAAKTLFDAGKVKVILVSGDNRSTSYDEPTAMSRYLTQRGVPSDRVVADYAGLDTYDSCVRARQIFGVDRLVVITQGFHAPRAVAICRAVGVDAIAVGDERGRDYAGDVYSYGEAREVLANVKAAMDVIPRRTPMLGRPETSVRDALAS